MAYLVRLQSRPTLKNLSEEERKIIERHFEIDARQVAIDGRAFELDRVDEIEIVKAARAKSPAGWVVKNLLYGGERYHIGIYAGREELVLPNITLEVARYIAGNIAFFARNPVRYKGLDNVVQVTER
jgi:hypothetical protein